MTNFNRSEVLSHISDLYKDVNGIRPRGYNFNEWSDSELESFWDELIVELEEQQEQERLYEIECIKNFKKELISLIEIGAGNRKTALRWMFDGYTEGDDKPDMYWDLDSFLYNRGIVHTDLGQKVKKQLRQIYA